jgi:cobalt-zinc-cadmium efflux system protein
MSRRLDHSGPPDRGAQRRALRIALVANAGFVLVEAIGGVVFRSLALLADAAHMVSDVAALGIALAAQSLLSRPASARHTYGLQRAEVLGAQANGVVLIAAAGWILYEATKRIGAPVEVAGGGLLAVALAGLSVNVASAVFLARARGRSLNMHGAFLHMVLDALGSVGAAAAGLGVLLWDANWIDPLVSIAIGALVLWSAWGLLKDTTRVLMEGSPRGLHPEDVELALASDCSVEAVHHLHLWNLASDVPALSAHVVLGEETSLHDAQQEGDRLKDMLRERFGIEHATLELECHPCEPVPEGARATAHRH